MKKSYKQKVEEIMEAIRGSQEFFVETYLGKIKVNGLSPDGDWAYTGSDLTARSWAICSTEVDRWYSEIN